MYYREKHSIMYVYKNRIEVFIDFYKIRVFAK